MPWQCLNFLPEPQGQGSLRPIFGARVRTAWSDSVGGASVGGSDSLASVADVAVSVAEGGSDERADGTLAPVPRLFGARDRTASGGLSARAQLFVLRNFAGSALKRLSQPEQQK